MLSAFLVIREIDTGGHVPTHRVDQALGRNGVRPIGSQVDILLQRFQGSWSWHDLAGRAVYGSLAREGYRRQCERGRGYVRSRKHLGGLLVNMAVGQADLLA